MDKQRKLSYYYPKLKATEATIIMIKMEDHSFTSLYVKYSLTQLTIENFSLPN